MFREGEALEIARELTQKNRLPINILGVKQEPDLTTFFFASRGRVDLRSLNRELADLLQTEVRFEESGPRAKACALGGLGRCGLPICCKAWLGQIPNVPLETLEKSALPTLPEKYTGACGRLLCCLLYENEESWAAPKPKTAETSAAQTASTETKTPPPEDQAPKKPVSKRAKMVRRLKI